jgi:hypothetical protein
MQEGLDPTTIAAQQLGRMRGMTRYYHERFFSDIKTSTLGSIVLFLVGWWGVDEAFLLIPVVALIGATMTAFDASYLIFARHYAAKLESDLNEAMGAEVLVAAKLEDSYLFPLNETKLVTASFSPFSWFSFMTLFFTALGIITFGFGLALGLPVLTDHGSVWLAWYLTLLAVMTWSALFVGWWWFVSGAGEKRLSEILDS